MLLLTRGAVALRRPWVCSSCRSLHAKIGRPNYGFPKEPARTRFAPSPTGYLHLGSLRTALFNYLLAKATHGKFILRLEDTDTKRTVPDAEERLYQDLKWAGLDWDEGPDIGGPFGPYKQSERTAIYREHAQKLVKSGHAYECFCTPEELNDLARQSGQPRGATDCGRACYRRRASARRKLAADGVSHVIRLKLPKQATTFRDIVYGTVGQSKKAPIQHTGIGTYGDPILLKSDGQPTYHLANVVDDHYMEITHVIRATEWMTSTPNHVYMYKCFGWSPPKFAHVGLLQDSNREKLSKRNDVRDLRSFENEGIFPQALVNYAALFGWSHKLGNDFLSMEELIKNFTLNFTKGNTVVQPAKLFYLQKKYAVTYVVENGKNLEAMAERVSAFAENDLKAHSKGLNFAGHELKDRVVELLRMGASRYTTTQEFYKVHVYFFRSIPRADLDDAETKFSGIISISEHLEMIHHKISQVSMKNWTEPEIRDTVTKIISEIAAAKFPGLDLDQNLTELKKIGGVVNLFLRWAIASGFPGPGMCHTMGILGREVTLQRLGESLDEFKAFENREKPLV